MKIWIQITILCLFAIPKGVFSQPNFSDKNEIEGISCFFDAKKTNTAYYLPGKLSIARNREGKPDFNLLRTGYIGTAATGDQYTSRLNSILRFRVTMDRIPAAKLAKIKKQLWPAGGINRLLPIPITDIKTNLVFAPISGNSETTELTGGMLTAEDNNGLTQKGNYWTEREFSLRLDARSAIALWAALDSGMCLLSLSYAFFSEGKNEYDEQVLTEGKNSVLKNLKERILNSGDSIKTNQVCVLADAFSISIDTKKWPDLLKKIDINQEVPPAYAALEVRCYDFYDKLNPNLLAKSIEIKAQGVGHGDVIVKARFSANDPDIYVYNIKFPYAVKLNKPLFYRITRITNETAAKTDWILKNEWFDLIDITSVDTESSETNIE